jgi:hypothetical protein
MTIVQSDDTALPLAAARRSVAADDENPKIFVLSRELSEVHLLLDNLSANPDKNLAQIDKDRPPLLPEDWVERVCRINWPPEPPPQHQTEEAALLIRAKDFLNTATKPATGATIAFTLLVTQEDNGGVDRRNKTGRTHGPTRHSLATNAYPGLVRRAAEFRKVTVGLSVVLFLILGLTCGLSWYTAFGAATLAQRASAQQALDTANKRVADVESGVSGDKDQPQASAAATKPATPLCRILPDNAASYSNPLLPPAFPTVGAMQACQAKYNAQLSVQIVDRTLLGWLKSGAAPVFWEKPHFDNGHIELFATSVENILGAAVLPVLYGILGAGAAVLRGIARKIKSSQLAPRDQYLSLQQLALGAVMGACISLFVSQPANASQATPGLLGAVALSSSALSFVAGFGVEAVFSALEAFIGRIFLVSAGTPPPKS